MQIKSIAVIGAGPLGRVIAAWAVLGGYATVLEDVNSETIEHALAAIRLRLDDADSIRPVESKRPRCGYGRV